jgi:hypothetical protein
VTISDTNGVTEMPSTYRGALNKTEKGKIQIGIDDTIEIVIPESTNTYKVLGGQLIYELNSFDVPDTFIVTDGGGNEVHSNKVKGKANPITVPFLDISGNLFIDVEEEEDISVWEASVALDFIRIDFSVPICEEDIPCPDISNPYKDKKSKTGKTDCYEF